jgi:hypothetical protein
LSAIFRMWAKAHTHTQSIPPWSRCRRNKHIQSTPVWWRRKYIHKQIRTEHINSMKLKANTCKYSNICIWVWVGGSMWTEGLLVYPMECVSLFFKHIFYSYLRSPPFPQCLLKYNIHSIWVCFIKCMQGIMSSKQILVYYYSRCKVENEISF